MECGHQGLPGTELGGMWAALLWQAWKQPLIGMKDSEKADAKTWEHSKFTEKLKKGWHSSFNE